MKKIVMGMILMFAALPVISGCGNMQAHTQVGDSTYVVKNPDNANLALLDKKLAVVSDEATALDAVNTFTDHVLSNLDKNIPQNKEIKTSSITDNLKGKFAAVEQKARQKLNGISVRGASDDELVSTDKLAAVLNDMQPDSDKLEFKPEMIESTQKAIRTAVPHLASTDSEKMTPLEASIISYYMMTGDDGSGTSEAIPLNATPDNLNEFADKLTTEGGDVK